MLKNFASALCLSVICSLFFLMFDWLKPVYLIFVVFSITFTCLLFGGISRLLSGGQVLKIERGFFSVVRK
ncbi:hypothetical protein D1814_06870 [Alteromonas sp. BL110]|nr:hypothetical protein D1814_06870 [Alteromonas sp. BL110]RKM83844.1 hypothetical protein D7031_02060 [Alteromonas sp. BL110]